MVMEVRLSRSSLPAWNINPPVTEDQVIGIRNASGIQGDVITRIAFRVGLVPAVSYHLADCQISGVNRAVFIE